MSYTGAVPDTAPRRRDWMASMACRDEDTDLFFEQRFTHMARTICVARCTVRAECLAHALAAERGKGRDVRHGIIAGLDGKERWRLDPDAPGHDDGTSLLPLDGPRPECGSYEALVRHLARGEGVDPVCWSGEVRRDHSNRSGPREGGFELAPDALPKPPAPKPIPECGTEQAWRVHRRRKTACDECETEHAARRDAKRREALEEEHRRGGSERGYMTHHRLGEPACQMCTEGARRDREARLQREARRPKRQGLTAREQRVRDLWEQSANDSEIARRTGISRAGVANIRRRLGLLTITHSRKAAS